MKRVVDSKQFSLHRIEKEFQGNFKPIDYHNLSDFHIFSIRLVGDAMRGPKSSHFWTNGTYCWFTDNSQTHKRGVWMTENGILMFEDEKDGGLYRVMFND